MGKPTFVFVPGAWHGPEAFDSTVALLTKAGYESAYVSLKSVGASPPLSGFEPDVELIKSVITQLTDAGKDVVLAMHSYGGVIGQQAVGELLKEGKLGSGKGSVTRMAWITAFAFANGTSLIKALGGNPLPWFVISEDGQSVDAADPDKIFYNDLSAEDAQPWIKKLKTHSYRTMFTEVSEESWREVPSAYLVCLDDAAIPYQAQEGMIAGIQAANPKAFDIVEKINASHSPFLSQPEATAKFLEKCAA